MARGKLAAGEARLERISGVSGLARLVRFTEFGTVPRFATVPRFGRVPRLGRFRRFNVTNLGRYRRINVTNWWLTRSVLPSLGFIFRLLQLCNLLFVFGVMYFFVSRHFTSPN
ncbi:hypothetical protein [Burkholderia ambifaria]|uniref:hypothetical protein n=1 Tax=Burkholderia ambifaria TaxID=152480 RepID=UPI00158EDD23|nr:hypothetical protein [Burkholderia ambifaria]